MNTKMIQIICSAAAIALLTAQPAVAAEGGAHKIADQSSGSDQREAGSQSSRYEAEANLAVLAFAKTKPRAVFEAVRNTMADAIEAKIANSLEQANVIAVYLNFDVSADNYRKLGLSDDEYRWLMSIKDDITTSSKPTSSGRT